MTLPDLNSPYDALLVHTLHDAIALGYPTIGFTPPSYAVRAGAQFLGWGHLRPARLALHAEDIIAHHASRHVDTITLLRAPNRQVKTERRVLAEPLAHWCGVVLRGDAEQYDLDLVAVYVSEIAGRVTNVRPQHHNSHLIYIEHFLMEDLEINQSLTDTDTDWKRHARAILAAQRIMRRVLC